MYEGSIGPEPHIEAKTSLFKAYTWGRTEYGLSRALALGSRLLDVHPSNLFMVVALSQFEKLQSAAYVTMHKWLCKNNIFCLRLDDNMNQSEEVGESGYHVKRGRYSMNVFKEFMRRSVTPIRVISCSCIHETQEFTSG